MNKPELLPKLKISNWSKSDRPREKYEDKGPFSVSDAELLAILLRTGTQKENAVDISKRLLSQHSNSLNNLSNCSIQELMGLRGIGKVKAITLHAAFELGRRRRSEKVEALSKINDTPDVIELMQNKIAELQHEEFWAIFLNNNFKILKIENAGKGGTSSTIVNIRQILKTAIEHNATGIILCHNHPSGNVKPSKADIQITRQIKEAAEVFNISLLDHIIINQDVYYSFGSSGLL